MQIELITSVIAAATALVAVFVGPFLSFKAQKKHILAPMRQVWINDLRDTIAEFLSTIIISRWHVCPNDDEPMSIKAEKFSADAARVELACRLKEKVALLINPREAEHMELVRLLESAYIKYHDDEEIHVLSIAIRAQAQKILKTEWDVVKGL